MSWKEDFKCKRRLEREARKYPTHYKGRDADSVTDLG
jgi:hypothetical protein